MKHLSLSLEQREEFFKLTRQAPGRVVTRAWIILLFADGKTKAEIADVFHCLTKTVKRWLRRYRKQGAVSLFDEPRSGAPRKIDKKLGEAVEEEMAKDPSQDGYQAGFWAVGLLCLRVKNRFSVKLSANTMRRALHKLGYVCRRPRLYTGGKEKQLPQEAEKVILKAKEGKAIALFSDESSFHLLPVPRRMWMKVGKQFRVLTPPRWNQYFTVFGALNVITGKFAWKIFDRRNVEKIWWWLKGNVAANRTWDKLTALREACSRQLDSLTLEKALRLTSLASQGVQNF